MAIAAAIATAIFWYHGSQVENASPILWVLPSIGISAVIIIALHGGWIAVLLGQVAMFVAITVYRVVAEKNSNES